MIGPRRVEDTRSHVSQQAGAQNMSIRVNSPLGSMLDPARYKNVVRVCGWLPKLILRATTAIPGL